MLHTPEQVTADAHRRRRERDPLLGTMLDDRFLIEARIATGGFGAVYRARTTAGELVAVKILHPRLTGDPSTVARFRREGATLTRLHDPNTVTTLAAGETSDGTLYIAMELLSGESLHARLHREGALAWRTTVAIARAVCSSLAEAHALGVVHRDLKPENIHVETRGDGSEVVKVIDFGIAKIAPGSSIDDGKELTHAGYMIGTYDYMSPEQIVGEPCRDLSDIYSLGVVTYEMLTGRRPFGQVTSAASMMAALLTRTPAPPSVLAALPPELDRIVMRCLEREPEDRFRNIRELAEAFDRLLARHHPEDGGHGGVTVEQPAQDPACTDPFPSSEAPTRTERIPAAASLRGASQRCEAPDATRADTERTWIGAPIATSSGASFGALFGAPFATTAQPGSDPLFTTLPGIGVATRPRTAQASQPVLPAPPPTCPVAPLDWPQASQPWTWLPAPAIPVEQLASGSGPQPPARPPRVRWVALALALVAVGAVVLAAISARIYSTPTQVEISKKMKASAFSCGDRALAEHPSG